MKKVTSNNQEEIRQSVSSIYSKLLDQRKAEKEAKEAEKLKKKQEKIEKKEQEKLNEDGTKKSKKQKREEELNSWESVLIGLTGDDLEYSDSKKKNKKKYRKWIDDEVSSVSMNDKPKKKKKKNYQKEFDPELNMLKIIVADQNKFTNDLQKRFQNAAGPATKDAAPLNKTLVDLAGQINASRQNALGLLREIGNTKKTIADLYMKQAKLDADMGKGGNYDTADLGLMGSGIAASMFGDNAVQSPTILSSEPMVSSTPMTPTTPTIQSSSPVEASMESFDPSTWDGPALKETDAVLYENIPHDIVVEWHKDENKARFKAVRRDNGEEIPNCPVPTSDPAKLTFNEKDKIVKGEFNETFKLEIVS